MTVIIMSRKYKQQIAENRYLLDYYTGKLMNIAISRFHWDGLPATVDARYLETTLLLNGNAVFFEDEIMGYLALNCAPSGDFDVYHVPNHRRAYSTANGYQKELDNENSVIIYDNLAHVNPVQTIQLYASKLCTIDNVIELNLNAQKTPILIACDENEYLSLKNLYMQYETNIPYIFSTKGINSNSISVLRTDAPYLLDKLYEHKSQIWNEALTALGISNVSFVKRERLISDEVTRAQGGVFASRYSNIEARQLACSKINRMFDLNISCEFKDLADGTFDTPDSYSKNFNGGDIE